MTKGDMRDLSSSLDPALVPGGKSFIQHTFVNTRFCLKEFGINLWTKETRTPHIMEK